jgi:hypothetical protein
MSNLNGAIKRLPIDEVRPYWRNPRRVPEEAVNALAESIRQYGYVQPIVTDAEQVIIIGHTRYAAMRRLGQTEVDVLVVDHLTPEQTKELRVIDNRVAEYTSWDYDKLVEELTGSDSSLLTSLFPEIMADDLLEADAASNEPNPWDEVDTHVDFTCPRCFHSWEMDVTKDAILSGTLEVKENQDATA